MMPRTEPVTVSLRQRRLLSLLAALGGNVCNIDFQKLLYLHCVELGEKAPYEFVPYKRGAFSFTSYVDRRKLIERGLLEDVESAWKLTDLGRTVLGTDDSDYGEFIRRTASLRGDELVAETYRRFPHTAIRSEIAGQVLAGDIDALRRIQDAKPRMAGPALFTIGYEGRSLERYESSSLPSQEESMGQIAGWIRDGAAVALTCFEGEPHRCHRHCVAEAVERRLGLRATHL